MATKGRFVGLLAFIIFILLDVRSPDAETNNAFSRRSAAPFGFLRLPCLLAAAATLPPCVSTGLCDLGALALDSGGDGSVTIEATVANSPETDGALRNVVFVCNSKLPGAVQLTSRGAMSNVTVVSPGGLQYVPMASAPFLSFDPTALSGGGGGGGGGCATTFAISVVSFAGVSNVVVSLGAAALRGAVRVLSANGPVSNVAMVLSANTTMDAYCGFNNKLPHTSIAALFGVGVSNASRVEHIRVQVFNSSVACGSSYTFIFTGGAFVNVGVAITSPDTSVPFDNAVAAAPSSIITDVAINIARSTVALGVNILDISIDPDPVQVALPLSIVGGIGVAMTAFGASGVPPTYASKVSVAIYDGSNVTTSETTFNTVHVAAPICYGVGIATLAHLETANVYIADAARILVVSGLVNAHYSAVIGAGVAVSPPRPDLLDARVALSTTTVHITSGSNLTVVDTTDASKVNSLINSLTTRALIGALGVSFSAANASEISVQVTDGANVSISRFFAFTAGTVVPGVGIAGTDGSLGVAKVSVTTASIAITNWTLPSLTPSETSSATLAAVGACGIATIHVRRAAAPPTDGTTDWLIRVRANARVFVSGAVITALPAAYVGAVGAAPISTGSSDLVVSCMIQNATVRVARTQFAADDLPDVLKQGTAAVGVAGVACRQNPVTAYIYAQAGAVVTADAVLFRLVYATVGVLGFATASQVRTTGAVVVVIMQGSSTATVGQVGTTGLTSSGVGGVGITVAGAVFIDSSVTVAESSRIHVGAVVLSDGNALAWVAGAGVSDEMGLGASFDLLLAAGSAVDVGGFSSLEFVRSFVGGFGVATYDEVTASDAAIPITYIDIRVTTGSSVSVQDLLPFQTAFSMVGGVGVSRMSSRQRIMGLAEVAVEGPESSVRVAGIGPIVSTGVAGGFVGGVGFGVAETAMQEVNVTIASGSNVAVANVSFTQLSFCGVVFGAGVASGIFTSESVAAARVFLTVRNGSTLDVRGIVALGSAGFSGFGVATVCGFGFAGRQSTVSSVLVTARGNNTTLRVADVLMEPTWRPSFTVLVHGAGIAIEDGSVEGTWASITDGAAVLVTNIAHRSDTGAVVGAVGISSHYSTLETSGVRIVGANTHVALVGAVFAVTADAAFVGASGVAIFFGSVSGGSVIVTDGARVEAHNITDRNASTVSVVTTAVAIAVGLVSVPPAGIPSYPHRVFVQITGASTIVVATHIAVTAMKNCVIVGVTAARAISLSVPVVTAASLAVVTGNNILVENCRAFAFFGFALSSTISVITGFATFDTGATLTCGNLYFGRGISAAVAGVGVAVADDVSASTLYIFAGGGSVIVVSNLTSAPGNTSIVGALGVAGSGSLISGVISVRVFDPRSTVVVDAFSCRGSAIVGGVGIAARESTIVGPLGIAIEASTVVRVSNLSVAAVRAAVGGVGFAAVGGRLMAGVDNTTGFCSVTADDASLAVSDASISRPTAAVGAMGIASDADGFNMTAMTLKGARVAVRGASTRIVMSDVTVAPADGDTTGSSSDNPTPLAIHGVGIVSRSAVVLGSAVMVTDAAVVQDVVSSSLPSSSLAPAGSATNRATNVLVGFQAPSLGDLCVLAASRSARIGPCPVDGACFGIGQQLDAPPILNTTPSTTGVAWMFSLLAGSVVDACGSTIDNDDGPVRGPMWRDRNRRRLVFMDTSTQPAVTTYSNSIVYGAQRRLTALINSTSTPKFENMSMIPCVTATVSLTPTLTAALTRSETTYSDGHVGADPHHGTRSVTSSPSMSDPVPHPSDEVIPAPSVKDGGAVGAVGGIGAVLTGGVGGSGAAAGAVARTLGVASALARIASSSRGSCKGADAGATLMATDSPLQLTLGDPPDYVTGAAVGAPLMVIIVTLGCAAVAVAGRAALSFAARRSATFAASSQRPEELERKLNADGTASTTLVEGAQGTSRSLKFELSEGEILQELSGGVTSRQVGQATAAGAQLILCMLTTPAVTYALMRVSAQSDSADPTKARWRVPLAAVCAVLMIIGLFGTCVVALVAVRRRDLYFEPRRVRFSRRDDSSASLRVSVRNWWRRAWKPEGEWRERDGATLAAASFMAVVDGYRGPRAWFCVVDAAFQVLLGVAGAAAEFTVDRGLGSCAATAWATVAVAAAYVAALVVARPHRTRAQWYTVVLANALVLVIAFAMAVVVQRAWTDGVMPDYTTLLSFAAAAQCLAFVQAIHELTLQILDLIAAWRGGTLWRLLLRARIERARQELRASSAPPRTSADAVPVPVNCDNSTAPAFSCAASAQSSKSAGIDDVAAVPACLPESAPTVPCPAAVAVAAAAVSADSRVERPSVYRTKHKKVVRNLGAAPPHQLRNRRHGHHVPLTVSISDSDDAVDAETNSHTSVSSFEYERRRHERFFTRLDASRFESDDSFEL